jgi:hypothetical protein
MNIKDRALKEKDNDALKVSDKQFNFKDNAKDIDSSFFNNLTAVLYARFSNYKRNKFALCNDAVLPACLLILGVGLSQIERTFDQPTRIVQPDRLPLPQSLLMNPNAISTSSSDITDMKVFYTGLPDSSDSFNVDYLEDWDSSTNTIQESIDTIYEERRSELPYRYGSYEFWQANKADQ